MNSTCRLHVENEINEWHFKYIHRYVYKYMVIVYVRLVKSCSNTLSKSEKYHG